MSNSDKTVTFTVPEDIYDRLTAIKKHLNCTYSEVIEKLVELEMKNNYIYKIREYEFITENQESRFRIIFRKEDKIIEYINPNRTVVKNIEKWDCEDRRILKKFLNKPNSLDLLENMGIAMEFDKFIILSN